MSINGIESIPGFAPIVAPTLPTTASGTTSPMAGTVGAVGGASAVNGVTGAAQTGGADFGQLLDRGIENLQGLHDRADQLAVQAATGDLQAIHDYTIVATEAKVSTQLTTAVRNKALEAFQSIMHMAI
jgi:flagellar hook-basal body complex protein FliE